MKRKKKSTSQLREKAMRLYSEYEALCCLINCMTIDIKTGIDRTKAIILKMDRMALVKFIDEVSLEIKRFRNHYGAKVSNQVFLTIYNRAANDASSNKMCLMPKYIIKEYFTRYERAVKDFDKLAEHTRIGIDLGDYREEQGPIELYLLEACLFEDMCALFNLSFQYYKNPDYKKGIKKTLKSGQALERATITTAYYFIEAYLNGIAFDYYLKNEKTLDEKTKTILTEWDFKNRREKFLSLRDKILQYTKIITQSTDPPIQESNCEELAFLLSKAKMLRDSIVHASPKHEIDTYNPAKERAFFETEFNDVELIVDNSIKIVAKIENLIYNNLDRLWWIKSRGEDGLFSDAVFV